MFIEIVLYTIQRNLTCTVGNVDAAIVDYIQNQGKATEAVIRTSCVQTFAICTDLFIFTLIKIYNHSREFIQTDVKIDLSPHIQDTQMMFFPSS